MRPHRNLNMRPLELTNAFGVAAGCKPDVQNYLCFFTLTRTICKGWRDLSGGICRKTEEIHSHPLVSRPSSPCKVVRLVQTDRRDCGLLR